MLILDEPYANIDLETKLVIDDLLNNIAREHITMLMTTHIEPSLNNYTAIVMINGEIIGKIEMENTIKLILMCSGEKIELTERELDKVNYLVRSGCNLTEISTSSLTARLRHLIHHR